LIGDPKQLPATTFSPDSNKTLYNRSLFERFIDNGITPFFLDEQYRMHESIREFPSLMFYENRLKDGEIIKTRKFPKYLLNFETKNLFFIDLGFSKEKTVDYSYSNEEEAWLVKI
jgi:senataxin